MRLTRSLLALLVLLPQLALGAPAKRLPGVEFVPQASDPVRAGKAGVYQRSSDSKVVLRKADNTTVDFDSLGGSAYDPNAVVGLKFQGSQHVNFGGFWKGSQVLGNSMLWEAWAAVDDAGSGYLVSDGYGGAHALLWNPLTGGNIWNGSATQSFTVADSVPIGQIAHYAVGLGTDHNGLSIIVTHVNGVPSSYAVFTGTRAAPAGGGGELTLFVGGSDHIHFNGRLYQMRAYDFKHPHGANGALLAFVPERSFIDANTVVSTPVDRADFLVDLTHPARVIADLSQGYHGGDDTRARIPHSGALFNPGGGYIYGRNARPPSYPLPLWETTSNHPFTLSSAPPAPLPARNLTPASVPPGALVFDSFSREDQTFAWQNAPTLGSTEGGSRGALVWQTGLIGSDTSVPGYQWGILNGKAVFIDGTYPRAVAWVDAGQANMDVRVKRSAGTGQRGTVALAYRVVDRNNFCWASFKYNETENGSAGFACWVAGTLVGVGSGVTGLIKGSWETFRVVANGDNLSMYLDGDLLTTATSSQFNTATKAGLYMPAAVTSQGNGGFTMSRWDDFTVYAP